MRAFWDPAQLAHAPQFFLQRGQVRLNLECPSRALALLDGLAALRIVPERSAPATAESLLAVHDATYLAFLQNAPAAWAALDDAGPELIPSIHPSPEMLAQGGMVGCTPDGLVGQIGWFTADLACPITAATWSAAVASAACAIAAADAVMDAGTGGSVAYALTRPPGHHAYPGRAGGHCYLNNAAIAAERLRARGAKTVGVLDIDAHHGNGTQGVFWTRRDVTTVSIHGDPAAYYPWYVGHARELGSGDGHGANLNLPLPRATADKPWLDAIAYGLEALAQVDAVVVALGFDASVHEPLAYLKVNDDGFSRAGALVQAALAGRPVVVVQEGGYHVDTLGPLLARFLSALA